MSDGSPNWPCSPNLFLAPPRLLTAAPSSGAASAFQSSQQQAHGCPRHICPWSLLFGGSLVVFLLNSHHSTLAILKF